MNEYLVVKPIMLSFMDYKDQYDCPINVGSIIGWQGNSIYLKVREEWRESITSVGAINVWMGNKFITPVTT